VISQHTAPTLITLPHELLVSILNHLPYSKDFYSLSSTSKFFYHLCHDPLFLKHHFHQRTRKKYLHLSTDDDRATAQHVSILIRTLISQAASFAHDFNTCINEAINSWRTKDLPKSQFFPATYEGRAWLSVLRRNLGGHGHTLTALWQALGLTVTPSVQAHCKQVDKQQHTAHHRKSSKQFHRCELQLARELGRRREEE
jgi:hypothetical protein